MKLWTLIFFLLSAGITTMVAAEKQDIPNPWPDFVSPSSGTPEAIGNYDAGCLKGAEALPEKSPNYYVMRPQRHRYFAHPDLVQFIEDLAAQAKAHDLGPLLVGDMGQVRGGPSLSSHASHQIGLDVDIWYWRPAPGQRLRLKDLTNFSAPLMVVPDFNRLNKHWHPETIELLKLAASNPRVDRIFVNPIIKREVCKAHPGEPWVARLRPWWNHDDHFHVRLACPQNNSKCYSKEDPVPEGDGCGADLDAWFTPEKKAKARYMRTHPSPPEPMPVLPDACKELLKT